MAEQVLSTQMPDKVIKYIERHKKPTRQWHTFNFITVLVLAITGIFLFTPIGSTLLNTQVLLIGKILHRVFAVLFIINWIVWVMREPDTGWLASLKHIFAPWNENDRKFMASFFGYMWSPKAGHMPRQDFVKSGQRVSDFFMYFILLMFIVTGLVLWIGPQRGIPQGLWNFFKMGHDICFMGWLILMVFHVYLGGGLFPAYGKQAAFWMFGSGYVTEDDGLYHWGKWAEDELEDGRNVLEIPYGVKPQRVIEQEEYKKWVRI
ncbi:MAG: cytochrome b/b6 domain-containing protein [Coriobacteriia bacterium]|nr:cytochrome b/b6 domain-containing protein [Coriobacteriia bacterium]